MFLQYYNKKANKFQFLSVFRKRYTCYPFGSYFSYCFVGYIISYQSDFCIYTHTHIYIYIYIKLEKFIGLFKRCTAKKYDLRVVKREKERELERERGGGRVSGPL